MRTAHSAAQAASYHAIMLTIAQHSHHGTTVCCTAYKDLLHKQLSFVTVQHLLLPVNSPSRCSCALRPRTSQRPASRLSPPDGLGC